MIRPFTFITAVLALGSGFYLYQAKHRTALLDARISAVEQTTARAESRIVVLRAEWALENAPSRLADLAAHYLLLVPMAPAQAVSLGNLASRLPPPGEPGWGSPAISEPDLVASVNQWLLSRYASLDYFSGPPAPTAAPSAAVAQVAALPPAAVTADVGHPPPPPVTTAIQYRAPAAPDSLARLSPPTESTPAPRPAPRVVQPALVAAAPSPPAPLRTHATPGATPILTSSLGGVYPALPPPAPLSGSH
ncbi:MAG: cell division protein FtsL [Acetobacteraceae bacterium]